MSTDRQTLIELIEYQIEMQDGLATFLDAFIAELVMSNWAKNRSVLTDHLIENYNDLSANVENLQTTLEFLQPEWLTEMVEHVERENKHGIENGTYILDTEQATLVLRSGGFL